MGRGPFAVRIRVDGEAAVLAALKALPPAGRRRLRAEMARQAAKVAAAARRLMPVMDGVARASIESGPTRGPLPGAFVRLAPGPVLAHSPDHEFYPAVIEYGGVGRPPVAPMRRALAAEGKAAQNAIAAGAIDGYTRT